MMCAPLILRSGGAARGSVMGPHSARQYGQVTSSPIEIRWRPQTLRQDEWTLFPQPIRHHMTASMSAMVSWQIGHTSSSSISRRTAVSTTCLLLLRLDDDDDEALPGPGPGKGRRLAPRAGVDARWNRLLRTWVTSASVSERCQHIGFSGGIRKILSMTKSYRAGRAGR